MNNKDFNEYEVLYSFDESEMEADADSNPLSIPDAFLACRRQLHVANIGYIAELAHTTKEEVALALQGTALFQNPEFFMRNAIEWNIDDGWEFREQFLSGFLPFKLRSAKIVKRHMNGKFDKEVRALEKLTDDSGMIQTMPVFGLGSTFIQEEIYATFIQTLLRLRDKPRVVYNPLKARFHIGITNQDDLRQAKSNPLYNTTRMNAIEIITKTMNAATVKVYDERTDCYGKVVRIFNKAETYRAQEIQKKLIEVFKSYINSSASRRKHVKEAYAKTFIGFHSTSFDGSYLMFSLVCNFHYEDCGEEIPEVVYSNVTLQKTDEQEEYIKNLGERTELIRQHLVSRKEDNLLKITTDGRKCALDMRLTDPYQSGGGKIEACAEKIWQLYRHYDGKSQVVFSDIGTPKEGFNVYDELKEDLAELGVPRDEIAFIHEAKTERQRARLFEAVNEGRIRVIIGSTEKLGVGVNIQKNLIALHHLSIPWRPSDVEQREGRILRRGNSCEKVFIYRYITEGSFDAYSWQLLENKALCNRLMHMLIEPDYDAWKLWALNNGIDSRIVGYLAFDNSRLCAEPESSDIAYPTPRSWSFVSNLLKTVQGSVEQAHLLIASCVGVDTALGFDEWCKIYDDLPAVEEILAGRCRQYPKKHDALFALTSSLSAALFQKKERLTDSEIHNVCAYALRFPPDFATTLFSDLNRDESIRLKLMSSRLFGDWLRRNKDFIVS